MDIVERIFRLLAETNMEQKEFAALIGVSENVVSTWRTGRTKSYSRYLTKIAEVLKTTPEYLLTGSQPTDDPVLSDALAKFRRLTPEQRAAVQMMIDSLAAQNESK